MPGFRVHASLLACKPICLAFRGLIYYPVPFRAPLSIAARFLDMHLLSRSPLLRLSVQRPELEPARTCTQSAPCMRPATRPSIQRIVLVVSVIAKRWHLAPLHAWSSGTSRCVFSHDADLSFTLSRRKYIHPAKIHPSRRNYIHRAGNIPIAQKRYLHDQ